MTDTTDLAFCPFCKNQPQGMKKAMAAIRAACQLARVL